ncbi:MAG: (2Fe-2S) ferredoxin domain-containing protein [Synechococcales cyanobacterium RM1_1_8]|nr:(2Fe-2S) ferredoxin domain-containing protein [Synechococcales cyanobacterium RM1_1_8]
MPQLNFPLPQRVTPLNQRDREDLPTGGWIEFEDFPVTIDITAPLLHSLFVDHWQQVGVGHMVDGSVLELELNQPPKICRLYDGYLTVVTEGWHLHLCLEPHRGGPDQRTPSELSQRRLVSRGALYRRFNAKGQPRSWGIQFWNGAGVKMMNLFLPNPFVGENEDLLPENRPNLDRLKLYEQLRCIYVLGEADLPYRENPLKRPFISVCRSSRCNGQRDWQPVHQAVTEAVEAAGLDIDVISSGCLEVCKMGPIVFYSGDGRSEEMAQSTWYSRVTPEVAQQIVTEHLGEGCKVRSHLYPPIRPSGKAPV